MYSYFNIVAVISNCNRKKYGNHNMLYLNIVAVINNYDDSMISRIFCITFELWINVTGNRPINNPNKYVILI
jgi:hypothetical protein